MPGLDSNMFIDLNESLSTHLKCGICTEIFNKPVEALCKHIFCEDCIEQWLRTDNRKECPVCRQRINGCQISRIFNNIIDDLKVKCNVENCNKIVSYGSLNKHVDECEHRRCPECGLLMGYKDRHNCLKLIKEELIKSQQVIDSLNSTNVYLEAKLKEKSNQNNCLVVSLTTKVDSLINELKQLKTSPTLLASDSCFYVSKEVETNKAKCFRVHRRDDLKLFQSDNTFIELNLISTQYPVYSQKYCMKKTSGFALLKTVLMLQFNANHMPELRTSSGDLILEHHTPSALNMCNNEKILFKFGHNL